MEPIRQQAQDFFAEKRFEVGSAGTVDYYERKVRDIFLPWALTNGVTDCGALTIPQWAAYVAELRRRPLATATVLSYLRAVRVFMKFCGLNLELYKVPQALTKERRILEVMTREEIDQLEAAATNERDKLIIRVLANTGLRLSEMTGLTAKDLREVTSPRRSYFLRVIGKGNKQRDVPVDVPTFRRLKQFAAVGGERQYIFPALAHNRKTGELMMFDGKPLSHEAVEIVFRRLRVACKIQKKCTPHALRHAFITYCLQQGMPIEKVAEIVGHTDLTVIIRHYKHLLVEDLSLAHEKVFGQSAEEQPRRRKRVA